MKKSGVIRESAVTGIKFVFDVYDAIDARNASDEIQKCVRSEASITTDSNNPSPSVVIPIPLSLAFALCALLDKIAEPARKRDAREGLFTEVHHIDLEKDLDGPFVKQQPKDPFFAEPKKEECAI